LVVEVVVVVVVVVVIVVESCSSQGFGREGGREGRKEIYSATGIISHR